jgi:hypothetical protein
VRLQDSPKCWSTFVVDRADGRNIIKQDQIDKKTLEISQADNDVYTKMQDVGDELPDHAPRFILLSYPLTLVSNDINFAEREIDGSGFTESISFSPSGGIYIL